MQYFFLFQVTDEELFAWYDKEGTKHWMTDLRTSMCNSKVMDF